MTTNKTTPKELWARQQISGPDVDYDLWNKKRISVQAFSQMSQSCIFTVDVFKERYDFASDSFAHLFGYNPNKAIYWKREYILMTECNSRNAKSSMDSSSTHSHRKKEMITGKYFNSVC